MLLDGPSARHSRVRPWQIVLATVLVAVVALLAVGLYEAYRRRPQESLTTSAPLHYTTHRIGPRDAPTHYVLLIGIAYANGNLWRILLHEYWHAAAERNADGSTIALQFIVPDLLGTGKSPWPSTAGEPDAYSVQSHCRALKRVLVKALPRRAPLHIVGVCLGGILALHLAASVNAASLSLISVPYFSTGDEAWRAGEQYALWYRQPWLIKLYTHAVARQRWLLGPLLRRGVALKCPGLGVISDAYCDARPEALRQSLLAVSCRYRPQRAALRIGSARVPTLALRGERDPLCSDKRQAQLLADTGARGLVVRGKGATHNVHVRQPKLVIDAVNAFIRQVATHIERRNAWRPIETESGCIGRFRT